MIYHAGKWSYSRATCLHAIFPTKRRCPIDPSPGKPQHIDKTSQTTAAPRPTVATTSADDTAVLHLTRRQRLGPDHRDIYVLIVGLVLGLLAGPWVLGRVMPDVYQRAFVGAVEQRQAYQDHQRDIDEALDAFDAETARLIDSLEQTDVTDIAIEEKRSEREVARQNYEIRQLASALPLQSNLEAAQRGHLVRLEAMKLSLLLAVVVLMIFEAMLEPRSTSGLAALRPRLATARYGVIAIWLALVLAAPVTLLNVQLLFVAGIVVVAVLPVILPLTWLRGS